MSDFDELGFEDAVEKYKELGRRCRLMTMECHPYKMNVIDFAEGIKGSIDHFISNMLALDSVPKLNWAEDWMELFQAWSEMEKGDFSN